MSFQELAKLSKGDLSNQRPFTFEEMRDQAMRIKKSMQKSREDVQNMTMDQKRSHVAYIVRFDNGRTTAQEIGLEDLFDEYLEDIKMRLPNIDRREWVFFRIQEFASRKEVTDQQKKLHEEYLHYGGMEEVFEDYVQRHSAENKTL